MRQVCTGHDQNAGVGNQNLQRLAQGFAVVPVLVSHYHGNQLERFQRSLQKRYLDFERVFLPREVVLDVSVPGLANSLVERREAIGQRLRCGRDAEWSFVSPSIVHCAEAEVFDVRWADYDDGVEFPAAD